MPFKKGHKIGFHGRQNPPGGRPTFEQAVQKEAKKRASYLAGEMLLQVLQEHLGDAVAVYIGAATGKQPTGGRPKKVEIDIATVRHFIERFAPPAPRKVELGLAATAEDFFEEIMAEESARVEAQLIEDKSGESSNGES